MIPDQWNPVVRNLPAAIILALLCIPYFLNLGVSSLWDSNESFYAETPREMLESGDLLVPRFNYQWRTHKPPLTYWLVAGSYRLFGIREFSVRLPGALAMSGLLVLVYWAGKSLYGPGASLLAAAIVSTSLRSFVLVHKLPIDALLVSWLSASGIFLVRALRSARRIDWALAYVFSALAFLTKGPAALVIPLIAVLAWYCVNRADSLVRPPALMGVIIYSAVVMPWYILIYRAHGWAFIAPFFLGDNLGRFANESFGPSRGFFFYILVYAAEFLPWSIVSLAAIAFSFRDGRRGKALGDPVLGFPLLWSAVVLAVFTLAKNKQEYYIAPIYPMMALFIAGSMCHRHFNQATGRSSPEQKTWKAVFLSISGLLAAQPFVIWFLLRLALPDARAALMWLPFPVFLGASVLIARASLRAEWVKCYCVTAGSLWLAFAGFALFYLPQIEELRPVPRLCRRIQEEILGGGKAGYFGTALPSMAFYLRRPIFEEFHADSMELRFRSSERVFCILTERDYNFFAKKEGLTLQVLERHPRILTQLKVLMDPSARLQETQLLLVTNRQPGPGSPAQMQAGR
jgi:4-amino-4-deoxy-L-arabinose transferase-like glycosyltransferase